jgi:uncharacterized membrane protein YgcG
MFRAIAGGAALGVAVSAVPAAAQQPAAPSAEQLALQIEATAKSAESAARAQGLPEEQVQAAIANAVNALILNSGVRPAVALAAIRIARRTYALPRSSDPTIVAALSEVAQAVASTSVGSAGGGGGGAPIGSPPSAGGGGGGSGYRTGP